MAKIKTNGRVVVDIMRSAGMQAELAKSAARVLAAAQSYAPVDSGDYKNSLHVVMELHPTRSAAHIGSDSDYALIIEANHGVLSRALDSR